MRRQPSQFTKQFADGMKILRTRLSLTQQQLADLAKLDLVTVNQIERKKRQADIESLEHIAEAMNFSVLEVVEHGKQNSMENDHKFRIQLGNKIKQTRLTLGLTLQELSFRTKISVTHINTIEKGKSAITLEKFLRITKALKKDIQFFLDT